MRIGIDARELTGHPTGVGRYLAGLLDEWRIAPGAAGHEFLLYTHAPLTYETGDRFACRQVEGSGGTYWEQQQLPSAMRHDRLDLLFSPGYGTPLLTSIPRVVTIHDVSFVAHPEWFTLREGARRRFLARQAIRRARAVITVSDFSGTEIVKHLGASPHRVHVIRSGISRPATSRTGEAASSPRVLYVGSIFNRRHVPDLIAGFARLAQSRADVELDLVGDNRSYPKQDIERLVQSAAPDGRARWHRYVSDDELSRLYGAARAFAFLSEYEGFGLTPLEAIAAGVPPLLLDTPVAREVCGPAAMYVTKGDVPGITAALDRLLFDPSTRDGLLQAGRTVLQRYRWSDAAARTLDVLTRSA